MQQILKKGRVSKALLPLALAGALGVGWRRPFAADVYMRQPAPRAAVVVPSGR